MMRHAEQRRVSSLCCLLAIVCVTTTHLFHATQAQAYHFSKGWMPGRKRSDSPAARSSIYGHLDRRPQEEPCSVKAQNYRLALDVLKVRVPTHFSWMFLMFLTILRSHILSHNTS